MQEFKPTITTTGYNRSPGDTALYGLYRDVSVLRRVSNFMRVCPNWNQVIVRMIELFGETYLCSKSSKAMTIT